VITFLSVYVKSTCSSTCLKNAKFQKRFVCIRKIDVAVFAYNDYLCKKFANLLQKCPFGLTPPNISFDNTVRLFKTEQFRFAAFLWAKFAP